MSTFVDNGNILVKCKNRHMIFGDNGVFRSEVQFEQSVIDLSEREVMRLLNYNIGNCFIKSQLNTH